MTQEIILNACPNCKKMNLRDDLNCIECGYTFNKTKCNEYNYEGYIGRVSNLLEGLSNWLINKEGKLSVYRKHFIANKLNLIARDNDVNLGY